MAVAKSAVDWTKVKNKPSTVAGFGISDVLGIGQTWQNLTASRASGTTYTNSTGKPIFVSINLNTNAAGLAYAYVNLNGVDIGYLGQGSGGSPNTLYSSFCTLVIPSGATYKATITGSANFGGWFELR
jgi:hypothetical protein